MSDLLLWAPSTVLDQLRTLLAEVGRVNATTHWRTVLTDSESCTGIAPVCTSPDHPDGYERHVRECCPEGAIELYQLQMAEFVVAALAWTAPILAELRARRAVAGAEHIHPAALHNLIAKALATVDVVEPKLSHQETVALAGAVVQALTQATTGDLAASARHAEDAPAG